MTHQIKPTELKTGMRSFFEIDLENKEALENAEANSQTTSELATSAVNLAVLATPSGSFSFRFQVALEIIQNLKYNLKKK